MAMLGLRYDLRAPSWGSATHAEMYAACLDQARWGDERGIDFVVLSEHHGAEDGYIPAPVTMAAAIAGRTRRIGINIAAVLVPLHDPVRLAEELAVLDLASGGRVSFVAGVGYRYEEFEMAGIDRKQRGKLLEEYVDVMRKAWTGEPFEWRGTAGGGAAEPENHPHTRKGRWVAAAGRAGGRAAVDVHAKDVDEVRKSGVYRVVTPDECVELAAELGDFGTLILHPLMGGIPPDVAWESLELFERKVLPRLRGAAV